MLPDQLLNDSSDMRLTECEYSAECSLTIGSIRIEFANLSNVTLAYFSIHVSRAPRSSSFLYTVLSII
jgi:hypothetical protein